MLNYERISIVPETLRQEQIDKIINSLRVVMSANPTFELIDILNQFVLKCGVKNILMLSDDDIESVIDDIFPPVKSIEYVYAQHPDEQ